MCVCMHVCVSVYMCECSKLHYCIPGGFPYTGEFIVKDHSDKPMVEERVQVCICEYVCI